MKLAIPVDEQNINTTVCMSYGRTPFFMIYDTDKKEALYLDNSAISAMGGAGIKASQSLVDTGAEAVLTQRLGENAAEVLGAAGISIYKTVHEKALDNVEAFEREELEILTDIHPGFHGNH